MRNYVIINDVFNINSQILFQGQVSDKEENVQENGKRDFVQTLTYFPDPKHNGHDIKCVVQHSAFTEAALSEGRNEVSKELELYCKFIRVSEF